MPVKGIVQNGETISPLEVRSMLGIDNREIVNLCRHAKISPKKNMAGQIYFSKKEFETLKKMNSKMKSTSLATVEQQAVITNFMTRLDDI